MANEIESFSVQNKYNSLQLCLNQNRLLSSVTGANVHVTSVWARYVFLLRCNWRYLTDPLSHCRIFLATLFKTEAFSRIWQVLNRGVKGRNNTSWPWGCSLVALYLDCPVFSTVCIIPHLFSALPGDISRAIARSGRTSIVPSENPVFLEFLYGPKVARKSPSLSRY